MASKVNIPSTGQVAGQSSLRVGNTQGASKESVDEKKPSLKELGGGAAPNTNPTDGGKIVTEGDIALMEVNREVGEKTGAMRPAVTSGNDGNGDPAVSSVQQ